MGEGAVKVFLSFQPSTDLCICEWKTLRTEKPHQQLVGGTITEIQTRLGVVHVLTSHIKRPHYIKRIG